MCLEPETYLYFSQTLSQGLPNYQLNLLNYSSHRIRKEKAFYETQNFRFQKTPHIFTIECKLNHCTKNMNIT